MYYYGMEKVTMEHMFDFLDFTSAVEYLHSLMVKNIKMH